MVDVNLGNVRGLQGLPGATGNGIRSIEKTGTSGKVDTYTITYDNGSTKTFTVTNGSDGSTVSFTRTLSSGTKLGTITINGVSTDLYCNSGGSADIVTSWEQLLSDVKVPSEKLTKNTIDTKQDVLVSGTNIKTVNGNSIMGSGDLEVGSNAGTFTDLQELIDDADSGDIIVLDKDYKYNGTTDSSLSDGVVINKIITLIGNGHIIDANNSRKAFSINNSQYGLTLIDLVIQNGSNFGESGGAIYNEGTLIISDCDFRNNIADNAGAIYTANGSVLNISNSSFMYNIANGEHTGGGAIKSYGDLTITNSIFTQNEAYECGAIDSRSTFSLKNSTVKSNDATYHANIYSASPVTAYGCDLSDGASTYTNITNKPYLTDCQSGGVGTFTDLQGLIDSASSGGTIVLAHDYKYDSTIDASLTNGITVREKDITIIGNGHVIDGNNSQRAFYLPDINDTLVLLDLRIQNCTHAGEGGAIYTPITSKLIATDCVFTNNSATGTYGSGGVINSSDGSHIILDNCVFSYNSASYSGGVISQGVSGSVTVRDCVFSYNSTTGNGGAIRVSDSGTLKVYDTLFTYNSADTGGAIYTRKSGTIKNVVCRNNSATSNYADIYSVNNLTVYNCDISNISTTCYKVTNKNYLTDHQDITGKQDTLVSGTNIKTVNNESLLGSGNITVSGGVSTGTFTELQTLITNASSGDIITLTKDYQYDGTTDSSLTSGVVIDKTLTINANGHIIDGNTSARAFTMTGASNTPITLNLSNIIIQNCKTTDNGGAIYANTYANLTINNSLFTRNESRIGGAIYIYSHGILTITNSTFTYNKTTGSNCYGGAINAYSYCTVLVEESIFTNNSTTTRGGAIYGASNTNTTINNSILTNNSASEGGALSFRNLGSSTKLKMSGTSVYGNTASTSANIYCSASMTVYNCTLSDNASTYYNVTNYDDVSSENIVDNLTTDDATKVLSAKQGKALADMIGQAITYINGSGS